MAPIASFSLQFDKTAESDIRLLKTNILNNYNFFAQTYLYEKEIGVCPTGRITVQNNFRSISSQRELNDKLKNDYWINFYNDARFYEEGMRFSVADKNKFSRNAKNLEKVLEKPLPSAHDTEAHGLPGHPVPRVSFYNVFT